MDSTLYPGGSNLEQQPSDHPGLESFLDFAKALDSETTVVFFLPLPHDMRIRYPAESRLLVPRKNDPAPWIKFTEGTNFVGMQFWKVPDPPDRFIRQDVAAIVVANHRLTRNPLLAFPEIGAEFQGIEPVDGTIVELATAIKIESPEQARMAISDAFDRCVEELNTFLRAYRMTSGDPTIRTVTRQTCRPFIQTLFERAVGDEYEYYGHTLFGTHEPNITPDSTKEMSDDELWDLSVSLSRHQRRDPFSVWADIARSAHRYYLVDGDYSATVISCQTAFEVLLNTTLLCISWETKIPRNETRKWTRDASPFMSRITKHLQPHLGGNWSSILTDFKRISSSRNDIVHDGRSPSELDARDCLEALVRVEDFAKDRLAVQRKQYPRTALLLLGEPGFKKRNVWDRWTRDWISRNAPEEPDWILEFAAWRDS
ncbi:MAG TPA: hypothetical protein VNP95_05965 [Thermomicrobiales bacterium]|nr:hypothetical protein [Thermomicrobiales bacterium]